MRGTAIEPRKDRIIQEHVHDTYKLRGKLAEPTACSQCGAVFQGGRWVWAAKPSGAGETVCPACNRIHDKYPAGVVMLSGAFFDAHGEEIVNLARNEEEKEKGLHPLHRIMNIEKEKEAVVIFTTDVHLPRRIGEALRSAYEGELNYQYAEDEKFIRVSWKR
ncbi:MAG: BCAM0308 family protein [Nitrospirota bacterium]|nr:BCAM0308 family protein [Nitrospirota bacterium]